MKAKEVKSYIEIQKELRNLLIDDTDRFCSLDARYDKLNRAHDQILGYIEDLNTSSKEQRIQLRHALALYYEPRMRFNIMQIAYIMENKQLAEYLIDRQLLPKPMYIRQGIMQPEDLEIISNTSIEPWELQKRDAIAERDNVQKIATSIEHFQYINRVKLYASKIAMIWFMRGISQDTSSVHFLFFIPEIVDLIGDYVESNVFFDSSNMAVTCRTFLSELKNNTQSVQDVVSLSKVEEKDIVNGTYHIPEGITSIGNRAFYDCSNLISIVLPAGITELEDHAFAECSNLTIMSLPAGITFIGDYVFSRCYNFSSIIIDDAGYDKIKDLLPERLQGLAVKMSSVARWLLTTKMALANFVPTDVSQHILSLAAMHSSVFFWKDDLTFSSNPVKPVAPPLPLRKIAPVKSDVPQIPELKKSGRPPAPLPPHLQQANFKKPSLGEQGLFKSNIKSNKDDRRAKNRQTIINEVITAMTSFKPSPESAVRCKSFQAFLKNGEVNPHVKIIGIMALLHEKSTHHERLVLRINQRLGKNANLMYLKEKMFPLAQEHLKINATQLDDFERFILKQFDAGVYREGRKIEDKDVYSPEFHMGNKNNFQNS